MKVHIGKKIKRIRDNHNLSQDRFGKKIGLSGKTISAYETGRTNPPIKVLQKIVAVYKTPIININTDTQTDINSKIEYIQQEMASIKDILRDSLSL